MELRHNRSLPFIDVSIRLGYCNEHISQAEWLAQLTFICHSSACWGVPDRGASRSGSREDLLPGLQISVFGLCPHRQRTEGERELWFLSFLIRTLTSSLHDLIKPNTD